MFLQRSELFFRQCSLFSPWTPEPLRTPQTIAQLASLTNDLPQSVWSPQYPQLLMRCISNQKITPRKSENDESLQRCTVGREDGGEGRAGCCLPLLLLFSLWGLRWVSRLHLPLPSPCLHFWLSYSLCCFSSLNLFSLSLSPTLHPLPIRFSVSPRGLIYGCGAAET